MINLSDINSLIIEAVKQFSKPVMDGLGKASSDIIDKSRVSFGKCLTKYLKRSYDKYSKTKTLLYRDTPVPLNKFYVRTDLEFGDGYTDTHVSDTEFIEKLRKNRRVVITGTAGSGKSTFCKSIHLELIENPIGILPIFIELRHLNSAPATSLQAYISNSLSEIDDSFSENQLEYALERGKLLFILDGFDELNHEQRDEYEREIIKLSNRYQEILIIISSRPDNRFMSWEEFYTCRVKSLNKTKAKLLIEKLEYDNKTKSKFIKELDAELYEKHESFASNPLLLTMMLLTYEQIAEIPNKIHLFYEQAFLTLFNKHDSLKSLYKRKSNSNLPLDEFKKLLSAFSVLSYADRKYYFTNEEINKYLNNALQITAIASNSKLFLKDLLDTVCILQRDGNGYSFTHRSFQEYFTSVFLINHAAKNKYDIIDKISNINSNDNVIPMMFDINKDLLEQEWVMPRLTNLIDSVSDIPDSKIGKCILISRFYKGITTYRNTELNIDDDLDECKKSDNRLIAFRCDMDRMENSNFFSILRKIYLDEFIHVYKKLSKLKDDPNISLATQELIDLMLINTHDLDGFLSLESPTSLSEHIVNLIYTSCTYKLVELEIEFAKRKIEELTVKYSNKQTQLSDLLLG